MGQPHSVTGQHRYKLRGYSDQAGDALIEIRAFDKPRRIKRAATGLITWWGAAAVSILIPVAHFLLVPGFFLFGLVTFMRRLKTAAVVIAAHGTCPDCGAEQDLDIEGPWSESQDLTCRQCHRSLRLTAA